MIKATNLIQTGIAWIPEIPSDWELKRIKLLFDFNKNIVGKTSADYDVLSLTTKGVIKRDIESGMGKFPASFDGYQIVKPNSIMLCLFDMDVTPRVVGHVDDNGIISAAYTNIIPKKGIHSKYYYYYFLLQDKNKSLLALGTGIRITLNKDFFGTLKIPVPPLFVQNSIVAYLDKKNNEIDEFIKCKLRLIENLKELKNQIIEKLITKGLNSSIEFKNSGLKLFGDVPNHWQVKRLRYVSKKVKTGTTPSGKVTDYFENGYYNWFTPGDFNEDYLLLDSERKVNAKALKDKEVSIFHSNSVLIIGIGGTIGKVGLITSEASSNQQINAITFSKEILPVYGLHLLGLIGRNLINILDFTTLPILNQGATKDLLFLAPPIDEQTKIIEEINNISDSTRQSISKIEQEIASIKEFREAIITDLVTGKRSVPQLQMS